jgi:hypothetical protein
MKLRSIFASILASVALIGCVQEELPALKNIEVTPSYFTFGVEGGTKELKVTSAAAWEIKEALPEWVTVSALKGNASEKGESVTVTVAASTDTLARTAYLNFTCAGETQLVTVNQDAFVPDFPEFKGGDYWIVFEKGAALPLSSAYGYLYTAPVKEAEDGSIMGAATNIFTIKAVEGGFTIQDPAGQYYCMQGTYDSFNVYAELPEAGGVWTIKQVGKTAYEVANVANGKIMQYDPAYSSAGAYSSERGIYPNLVKVEVVPEPEPLGESMKIEEALEYKPELVVEGLVTATCTRGAILTDKSGSLLVYGLSNKITVGDSIKVAGKLDVYNKGYQLKDPNQFEYVDSVKHEVKYPAAVELTKTSLPDMVKGDFLAQYVSVKGIVATDTYNNALIKIGDYTVKTYYSADSYADLNGKAFEITGYMISYKESSKEANLLVTKVSEELKDFVPEVEEPETPGNPETPGEGGETTEPETPGEGGETTEPEGFVAGDYWVMDGEGRVVYPIDEGSAYGYWKLKAATADGDSWVSTEANVFTFDAVEGGFTIKDSFGRYHYMTTYNSFSLADELPAEGGVWTVAVEDDGTYVITNVMTSKFVQMSTYDNYAPYAEGDAKSTGELPILVSVK